LRRMAKPGSMDEARLNLDILIQLNLASFFAHKFRAGVLFAIYGQTQDLGALEVAITQYGRARERWQMITTFVDAFYGDLSCSDMLSERGAWADKLPLIDADIAAVKALRTRATSGDNPKVAAAVRSALAHHALPAAGLSHVPPSVFRSGETLSLAFGASAEVATVKLWYRHINQAERWQSRAATKDGSTWRADIPADYTRSSYPLQYYAEVQYGPSDHRLYPGFAAWPAPQPYIVLRRMA